MHQQICTVEEALEELRSGRLIITIDDPDRENEGDLICAARFATTENVNFMAVHAKGLICTPMSEEVAARLEPEAAKRDIQIRICGTDHSVWGVRSILEEMLYNLCENGIKYNREHGWLEIELAKEADAVRLSVRDSGIGIPPQHQSRVFERFYRVDKSHSKETGGTGLGLSIVKHGATFHGAKVELLSEEGKGTTIQLRFPKPTR